MNLSTFHCLLFEGFDKKKTQIVQKCGESWKKVLLGNAQLRQAPWIYSLQRDISSVARSTRWCFKALVLIHACI